MTLKLKYRGKIGNISVSITRESDTLSFFGTTNYYTELIYKMRDVLKEKCSEKLQACVLFHQA